MHRSLAEDISRVPGAGKRAGWIRVKRLCFRFAQ